MQLSTQEKSIITAYFAGKPVLQAWLFGSYARGDADEQSDIDLMVKWNPAAKGGLDYFIVKPELENLLGKKVDVVSEKYLSKHLQPIVSAERVLIYEK